MTKAVAKQADGRMSLMEHLIELRNRLIKCFVAIAIGMVVGWLLYFTVRDFLMVPLERLAENPNVADDFISFKPLEQLMLRIKVSAYIGIIVVMPFLLWQVWQFIAPGLYKNERRYAGLFIGSASVLFLAGAALAYYTLPEALGFLQDVGGDRVVYQYTAEEYLTLIMYMMVAFGIGFQFPIVLIAIQLVGLVTPEQLAGFRRFAIVLIFFAGALITPSGDPITLTALSLPMCIFYEVSILVGRLVVRRRAKAEAATS